MQPSENTVFIVEDDPSVRDALSLLLGLRGYRVAMFADAESFLEAYQREWCGCLLVDIRMPGMDGLTLQKRMLKIGCKTPIIIMTGHGSVEAAREAFRAEAIDFLEKPIDHVKLISAIGEAFNRQMSTQEKEDRCDAFSNLLVTLTPREKEVMEHVVAGQHNREIARALGISTRTVEVHKARMLTKLRVNSLPDLVRLSLIGHD